MTSPLRTRAMRWAIPAAIWAVCAGIYVAVAGERILAPTPDNHFVHLANSFLHGQLGVVGNAPPGTNDWACYDQSLKDVCPPSAFSHSSPDQHWYVSFPPFPALVILPAVAIWGTSTRDALFWALFAGLGPALLYALLRSVRESGESRRTPLEDLILTALFAFGTVYFFVAVNGSVWFAAQVVATTLIAAYLWASLDGRHPFWAGILLGCCFITRPNTSALVLFFALEALRRHRSPEAEAREGIGAWLSSVRWKEVIRSYALFAIPILAIAAIAMWMNHARWGRMTEFGHRYLMILWHGRIERWGLFSYHYLSKNLAVFLASLPWLSRNAPYVTISRHGLALWVTTPALVAVLWPKRRMDGRMIALAISAAAVALWNLCYQNSGWIQFGYRFSLDYMPLLILLLALGQRRIRAPLFLAATVFSIVVNAFGAFTFDRAWQYYDDDRTQNRLFQPD